jgi:polysaccharide biosynthesis protein PslG
VKGLSTRAKYSRVAIVAAAVLIGCGGGGGGKAAPPSILVGIGDQDPATFTDPHFKALGIRRARIIVPWNVALSPPDELYLDGWLQAARAARVEPLVHFGAATGTHCPARPCPLPTVAAYSRAFRAFRMRWPWVRTVGVWNEANQRAQPTFRHPERAAEYFNAMRRACPGCHVVAADVLDDPNMVEWVRAFRRRADGPRIWGLHNYRDTNPRPGQIYGGTRRLLSITRGQVWLTEAGGIVKFVLPNGHTSLPPSEQRANRALKRLFALAKRYRRRIRRIYLYNWRAPIPQNRFDSGLLRNDGTPRPAYSTLKRGLGTPDFRP